MIKYLFLTMFLLITIYAQAQENDEESKEDNNTTTIRVIGSNNNTLQELYPNSNVLDDRVLKESGSGTIYDSLSKVGTISVGTEFKDSIDIRGQGADKARRNVQVLLDDMPLNLLDYTHYFPGYNVIPVESVKQIEIIPGGGSVIYGNGVQGGVVRLSTGFTTDDNPTKSIYFGFGSFNTKRTALTFGDNTLFSNKLILQFDYSGETNESYLRGEHANTDHYSMFAKYKISDNQIVGYSYSYYTEDGKYSGVVSQKKIDKDWRASGVLYDRDREMTDHKFIYKGTFFDSIEIDDTAFLGNGNWRGKHEIDSPGIFTHDIKGNKAKVKINYDNKGSFFLLGNDLIKMQQGIVVGKDNWDYQKTTLGFFGLNKINFSNFYSTQGYRFNRDLWERYSPEGGGSQWKGTRQGYFSTKDNNAFELSLGYNFSSDSNAWIRSETGFTAPDASNLTDTVDGKYRMNNLKYENFITYEIGSSSNLTDTTYGKIALFYTDTQNEISTFYVNGISNSYSINVGRTARKGIELSLEQQVTQYVDLFFNGTYLDARLKKADLDNIYALSDVVSQEIIDKKVAEMKEKEGKKLSKVPPVSLSTGFAVYVGDITITNSYVYTSNYIPDFNKQNLKVGGKIVSDLDVRYKKDKFNIGMGINNLFDQRYYTLLSGATTAKQAMERNYYIDVRYQF